MTVNRVWKEPIAAKWVSYTLFDFNVVNMKNVLLVFSIISLLITLNVEAMHGSRANEVPVNEVLKAAIVNGITAGGVGGTLGAGTLTTLLYFAGEADQYDEMGLSTPSGLGVALMAGAFSGMLSGALVGAGSALGVGLFVNIVDAMPSESIEGEKAKEDGKKASMLPADDARCVGITAEVLGGGVGTAVGSLKAAAMTSRVASDMTIGLLRSISAGISALIKTILG